MFSKKSLEFLAQIEQNNSKEWFEAHKEEYKRYILEPSRLFVQEMGEHLLALNPFITFAPKVNYSLFKIYRDARRMGYDKRPIKEKIGFIWWQGGKKRLQSSSFYMHFSKSEIFVATGVRWFEKPQLEMYRNYIKDAKRRCELLRLIEAQKAMGYKLIEPKFKRNRFIIDDECASLALYGGMALYTTYDAKLLYSNALIDTLFHDYKNMLPFQQKVYEIVGEGV